MGEQTCPERSRTGRGKKMQNEPNFKKTQDNRYKTQGKEVEKTKPI